MLKICLVLLVLSCVVCGGLGGYCVTVIALWVCG